MLSAVALGLIPAAVFAALAFSSIGELPLWLDEVWSVDIASRPIGGVFDVIVNREANMGLYYVVLHLWLPLGDGEATVRSLSAFAGIATIIATGVLGAHLFNRTVAVASTVMLATSTFLLTYAQEARAYTLIALAAVASFAAFVRMVERGEKRDLALWVAASTVLVYLHLLAALLIVAQAASLLAAPNVRWRRVLPAACALALTCSPLVVFALFRDRGQSGWIPAISAYDALRTTLTFYSGGRLLTALFGALVLCALTAAVIRWRASGRCTQTFRVTLLACWVAIPPLGLLALSQVQPLYIQRYLFGILPGYALLVGVGVAALPTLLERLKLPTRWPSALAIAVVLGAAFLQLARHPPPYDKSEDLRAAARFSAHLRTPPTAWPSTPAGLVSACRTTCDNSTPRCSPTISRSRSHRDHAATRSPARCRRRR